MLEPRFGLLTRLVGWLAIRFGAFACYFG